MHANLMTFTMVRWYQFIDVGRDEKLKIDFT